MAKSGPGSARDGELLRRPARAVRADLPGARGGRARCRAGPGGAGEAHRPDLASSRAINDAVGAVFAERQVYRIDHYLGKETVLNLLALRFANSIFTTNWDHNTIDHVQITVAEEVGIEGRWGYFDQSGQLRDMVQNHLLQILTLVAMEPPDHLDSDSIRDEKLKVLKALRPITRDNVEEKTVRGQYAAGFVEGDRCPATSRRRAATPAAPPRPSSPSGSTSITGAGPACRSTCAPASGWPPSAPRW